jgi:phospholipid:diacylglycerol acyltransferase
LVPVSKLKKLTTVKRSKKKSWLIFGLGGLFGLVVAVFFANQQEVIKLEGLLDVNLDSLMDVIPAGIVRDAKDLSVRMGLFGDCCMLTFEASRA